VRLRGGAHLPSVPELVLVRYLLLEGVHVYRNRGTRVFFSEWGRGWCVWYRYSYRTSYVLLYPLGLSETVSRDRGH